MDFIGIAGLVLVVAGIAWIFLIEFGRRRRTADRGEDPVSTITKFLLAVLNWASKNIGGPFLPGVLMIVIGAFLLALSQAT